MGILLYLVFFFPYVCELLHVIVHHHSSEWMDPIPLCDYQTVDGIILLLLGMWMDFSVGLS